MTTSRRPLLPPKVDRDLRTNRLYRETVLQQYCEIVSKEPVLIACPWRGTQDPFITDLPSTEDHMRETVMLYRYWALLKYWCPDEVLCMPTPELILLQVSNMSRMAITYDPPAINQPKSAGPLGAIMVDLYLDPSVMRNMPLPKIGDDDIQFETDLLGYQSCYSHEIQLHDQPRQMLQVVQKIMEMLGTGHNVRAAGAVKYSVADRSITIVTEDA